MEKQKNLNRKWLEKITIVFTLALGINRFAGVIRNYYFEWLETLSLDEGVNHICLYLGHTCYVFALLLFAWAVIGDRKYILSFTKNKFSSNLKYLLLGGLTGFGLMGICVGAAFLNGDIVIKAASNPNILLFLFAAVAVFIQSSSEEVQARAFTFGKLDGEGVPAKYAIFVSSFFFTFLHMTNPGFSPIAMFMLFGFGVLTALSLYYFKNIWFPFGFHMMWNFAQDFIFGLPNSGKPSSISILGSTINKSSFFYDEEFGIEGSLMCLLVMTVSCIITVFIGRYFNSKNK